MGASVNDKLEGRVHGWQGGWKGDWLRCDVTTVVDWEMVRVGEPVSLCTG